MSKAILTPKKVAARLGRMLSGDDLITKLRTNPPEELESALYAQLDAPDLDARTAAFLSLAMFNWTPRFADAVKQLMSGDEIALQRTVALYLASESLHQTKYASSLFTTLWARRDDCDQTVRHAIWEALSREYLHERDQIREFLCSRLARDNDRPAVLGSLERMMSDAEPAVDALLSLWRAATDDPELGVNVLRVLVAAREVNETAMTLIADVMGRHWDHESLIYWCTSALGNALDHGPEAHDALLRVLHNHENRWVQQGALDAIGRLGIPSDAALAALESKLGDGDLIAEAIAALHRLGKPVGGYLERICGDFVSDNWKVRLAAVNTVAALDPRLAKSALSALRNLEDDPRFEVREAAAQAADSIEYPTRYFVVQLRNGVLLETTSEAEFPEDEWIESIEERFE